MNVLDFIAKWRRVELGERQASQQHFLDLCAVVGHPTPAAADPSDESFCFERGAARLDGPEGLADEEDRHRAELEAEDAQVAEQVADAAWSAPGTDPGRRRAIPRTHQLTFEAGASSVRS